LYNERLSEIRRQVAEINIKELQIDEADLFDKFSDPDNPVKLQFNDISAAAYRIKGGVEITPCTVCFYLIHLPSSPYQYYKT
jgi:threonine dehydratase